MPLPGPALYHWSNSRILSSASAIFSENIHCFFRKGLSANTSSQALTSHSFFFKCILINAPISKHSSYFYKFTCFVFS